MAAGVPYVDMHNFYNDRQCSTNSTEHPQVVSAVSEGFCSGCQIPLGHCGIDECSGWLRCPSCGMHFRLGFEAVD